MKKILVFVFTISLMMGVLGRAEATLLDFEGLTASSAEDLTQNNQGYGGFNWDFGWFLYSDQSYPNPAHSPHYGIVNNYGADPLGLSSASPFDFDGVWVSGWYFNSPQQIKAQGLDVFDNVIFETDFFPLLVSENQFLSANFQGVSRVNFLGGQYFTLDDFAFNGGNDNPAAPEPATVLLLGTGLMGVLFRGRRLS